MITLTVPATGPIHLTDNNTFGSEAEVRAALGRNRHFTRSRSTGWITPRRNISELLTSLVEHFGTVVLDEDGIVATVERDTVEFYARDIKSRAQHRRERMNLRRNQR